MIACPCCFCPNPASAAFCHRDATPLAGRAVAPASFAAPFVFPSGRAATTFDELAAACLDEWDSAVALLRGGALTSFLRAIGRGDLAALAGEAADFPDGDWALADLLDRLPTHFVDGPRLMVDPETLNLGRLRVGQEASQTIRLTNAGGGVLCGTVASRSAWLRVSRSHFGGPMATVTLTARGLRASPTPWAGQLVIESNAGRAEVCVSVEVPALSFASGVLAGARTPRQLVEKAKASPAEAARLFDSGEVARWYARNGWTYPVRGEPGPGAMARYVAALGLPPLDAPAAPWFAPEPPAVAWQPIARAARPAKASCAVPLDLPPPQRRRSRAWLLVLVPVALLVVVSVAGVGIALSLPSPKPQPVAQHPAPPGEESPAEPIAPPPPDEDPPPRVPRREEEEGPRNLVPRPQPPPVLSVAEFRVTPVEVVFVIDTTGSMGGLIRAAQDKIWSMCNQIAGGRPAPALKVGLVAYRDRGDDYVTKVTDLSRDLDAVHQELQSLRAGGGGDFPESVNQALDEAVNKIGWSKDDKTLRIVFLVGDAPPHLDYTDDVQYPITCKKAVEKGIVINAVQCGKDAACEKHWKQIAELAGGEYAAIAQAGGVRVAASPFDERMAELLEKLMDTALIHGNAASRAAGTRMVESAKRLRGPAAADRAAFAAKTKRLGPNDLLDDVNARVVKLDAVKKDALPEGMKTQTVAERAAHLNAMSKKREGLYKEVLELEQKRSDHLKKGASAGKDGFDEQVLKMLRKQAKKFDVTY